MSLVRIDLSGSLAVKEKCTKLLFSDTTGFVSAACAADVDSQGYGLVGGIALNDVTEAILNIYFRDITTPVIFTFTVANAVITAATLTDLNGDVTTITADLDSTVFPLTDFDITKDYGVTLPTLVDGVINWEYVISGTSGVEPFDYTTSGGRLVDCNTNCCIAEKYLDIDIDCGCSDDKIKSIIYSEIFLNAARYSVSSGLDTKTNNLIDKAKELCNNNCKTC
jgi:hypothetical protein